MKTNYVNYIVVLMLFQVIACTSKKESKKEAKKPNILFIMSDDHTSQAWGIYGGTLKDYVHTPNITRMAKEGTERTWC